MTDQNLHDLLEELHREVHEMDVVDESERERLRHLEADIRKLLARSGANIEADEPMLERLQEAIDQFEVTHPRLTMMLSQMMTILSNAGI